MSWEKQFPDAAWFSWEYSQISVIPHTSSSCWAVPWLVPITQSCSACSVLVLPKHLPLQAVPRENPALSSSFSAGFGGGFSFPPGGQDPAPQLSATASQVKPSSRCCWRCWWQHPTLSQELHPEILPIHCISRAGERFGMPQLLSGNAGTLRAGTWAEHTWSRGDYPHCPGKTGPGGSPGIILICPAPSTRQLFSSCWERGLGAGMEFGVGLGWVPRVSRQQIPCGSLGKAPALPAELSTHQGTFP